MKGIGVDIEEVARFKKLLVEPHALKKIFTTGERLYCLSRKNAAQHLAVRFAAKEAVYKALSGVSGARSLGPLDIEVLKNRIGAPSIKLPRAIRENVAISLSHTKEYAIAIALHFGKIKP